MYGERFITARFQIATSKTTPLHAGAWVFAQRLNIKVPHFVPFFMFLLIVSHSGGFSWLECPMKKTQLTKNLTKSKKISDKSDE